MTEKLLIVGAGEHGVVVGDAAESAGSWTEIIFADDVYPESQAVMHWKIIATSADPHALLEFADNVVVAIGDNSTRVARIKDFNQAGGRVVVIRHPAASISQMAAIGAGTVVLAGAVVNARAAIGEGCIINSGATVDHDCVLGAGVHISPGANLAGGVVVGDRSWIGIGAVVRDRIRIGEDVIVGAGAVVINNIEDGMTVVGNPALPIRA